MSNETFIFSLLSFNINNEKYQNSLLLARPLKSTYLLKHVLTASTKLIIIPPVKGKPFALVLFIITPRILFSYINCVGTVHFYNADTVIILA